MKPIRWTLWGLLAVVTVLFVVAVDRWPQGWGWFAWRGPVVQYTGALAIVGMAAAMLLAMRSRWLEARLDGLDKMYRLHKWIGIGVLVTAILHWWWAKGTKWMVGWGWLSRPAKGPPSGETLPLLAQWLRGQRGLAESVGEWAFYAAVLLTVLALIRSIPARWFRKTHHWLAVAYLVLVYHTLVLVKPGYWSQPVGWVLAALLVAGTASAVLLLAGRAGRARALPAGSRALTA